MAGIAKCPSGNGGAKCRGGFGFAKCPSYRRPRRCTDDVIMDIWMTEGDAALLPFSFTLPSISPVCVYFNYLDPLVPAGSNIRPASDASACPCLLCNCYMVADWTDTAIATPPSPVAWTAPLDPWPGIISQGPNADSAPYNCFMHQFSTNGNIFSGWSAQGGAYTFAPPNLRWSASLVGFQLKLQYIMSTGGGGAVSADLWVGFLAGNNPHGVYVRTGGAAAAPATFTVTNCDPGI